MDLLPGELVEVVLKADSLAECLGIVPHDVEWHQALAEQLHLKHPKSAKNGAVRGALGLDDAWKQTMHKVPGLLRSSGRFNDL